MLHEHRVNRNKILQRNHRNSCLLSCLLVPQRSTFLPEDDDTYFSPDSSHLVDCRLQRRKSAIAAGAALHRLPHSGAGCESPAGLHLLPSRQQRYTRPGRRAHTTYSSSRPSGLHAEKLRFLSWGKNCRSCRITPFHPQEQYQWFQGSIRSRHHRPAAGQFPRSPRHGQSRNHPRSGRRSPAAPLFPLSSLHPGG